MSLTSRIRKIKQSWRTLAATLELDFANDVFNLMQRKKISKSQLAKKMGVSPSYVTKILSGSANPSIESIAKIAHALDLSVNLKLFTADKSFDEKVEVKDKFYDSKISPASLQMPNDVEEISINCKGSETIETSNNSVAA